MSIPKTRAEARSSKINPKVTYAAGGAALGSAAATVAVWVIEATTGTDVPAEVTAALGIIAAAVLSFAAGWFKSA